ncbi:MAG: phage scaffolding protein [Clostridiales bacterium]|nr:phage scaffolding protein [Clostridiales bacterium]
MNRKFLESLGLERDVIDKVMAESDKTSKELESVKAELEAANKTVGERDKQLKELRKSAEGNEELSKKIKELEDANKAAAEAHRAEIDSLKIEGAVEKALISYRARTPKAVRAMLDMDGIKIDKDGSVTGVEEQLKAISEAEETKYLFDSGAPKLKGVGPGYGSGSENEPKPEDMTYSEMCAFLEANPGAQI